MKLKSEKCLSLVLWLIGIFHLVFGAGLMFSPEFQKFAASFYGATLDWDIKLTYFTRILGSFAFVLGTLACYAARNPLKHQIIILGFIEFFILRNIHRHLYAQELNVGFGVSSTVNLATTVFFGAHAIALMILLYLAKQKNHSA